MKRTSNWLQLFAVIAAAVVAGATSQMPYHKYPGWQIDSERSFDVEGLDAKVWVSKSGRGGIGVTVRLENPGQGDARVVLKSATFSFNGYKNICKDTPVDVLLEPGAQKHVYLPFVFDNKRAWKEGVIKGQLELELLVNGVPAIQHVMKLTFTKRKYYRSDGYSPALPDSDALEECTDSAALDTDSGGES